MRLLIDSSGPQLVCALAEGDQVTDLAGTPLAAALIGYGRAGDASGSPSTGIDSLPILTSIVVGIGPGSFIGTRTAISFANGYAAALDSPVDLRGVNSLAAIAAVHGGSPVLRDARRGQWYLQIAGSCTACDEAGVVAALTAADAKTAIVEWQGEAEPPLAGVLRDAGVQVEMTECVTPEGLRLAAASVEPASYVEPIYLRGFT